MVTCNSVARLKKWLEGRKPAPVMSRDSISEPLARQAARERFLDEVSDLHTYQTGSHAQDNADRPSKRQRAASSRTHTAQHEAELEAEAAQREAVLKAEAAQRAEELHAVQAEAAQRIGELQAVQAEAAKRIEELQAVQAEAVQREAVLKAEAAQREAVLKAVQAEAAQRAEELKAEAAQRAEELRAVQAEAAQREHDVPALVLELLKSKCSDVRLSGYANLMRSPGPAGPSSCSWTYNPAPSAAHHDAHCHTLPGSASIRTLITTPSSWLRSAAVAACQTVEQYSNTGRNLANSTTLRISVSSLRLCNTLPMA